MDVTVKVVGVEGVQVVLLLSSGDKAVVDLPMSKLNEIAAIGGEVMSKLVPALSGYQAAPFVPVGVSMVSRPPAKGEEGELRTETPCENC